MWPAGGQYARRGTVRLASDSSGVNLLEQKDERLGKKLLIGTVGLVAVAKHRLVQ